MNQTHCALRAATSPLRRSASMSGGDNRPPPATGTHGRPSMRLLVASRRPPDAGRPLTPATRRPHALAAEAHT